jgi:ferrous iron transport protein B
MATIYSVNGSAEKMQSVYEKMKEAKNPETGQPVFTLAVAFSLMMFYAFAMQCASTVAVVFPRNQKLALARYPIRLYDSAGLCREFYSVYVVEITVSNGCHPEVLEG